MKSYYTAEEAMKKLDLPKSTFHYLVRKGEINKIVLPLRKQAVYSRQEIDSLAREKEQMLADMNSTPERFTFVVPNHNDLLQLLELEKACFHEETIIPASTIEQRLHFNPENIHVLKDTKANQVVGSITMSPIKQEILEKLINLEIDETQVKVDEYLPFIQNEPLDCYVVSIIAKPCIGEEYYASRLLLATVNYLIELLDKGVYIRRLYTVATTEAGEQLAKSLHFTSLKTDWQGELEEFRHSYFLDMENTDSPSKLIRRYIQHKKNRDRRAKRYEKKDQKEI